MNFLRFVELKIITPLFIFQKNFMHITKGGKGGKNQIMILQNSLLPWECRLGQLS